MKYYLYKLRTLKVHIVLMCIFAAASYPLFSSALAAYFNIYIGYDEMVKTAYNRNSAELAKLDEMLSDALNTTIFMGIIGAVALIAMFTTAIPVLVKCFGYLSKKPLADMEMSAPVTVRTRFFGSFFAGLTVYLVPHVIAAAIGWAEIGGDTGVRVIDNVHESYRRMMIYGLMMCVLFYCSTALIVAVCGRIRTAVILTVFMNFAVPAVTICAGYLSFTFGYGLNTGLVDEMFERVGWFSPLGLLIKYLAQGIFGSHASGMIQPAHLLLFLLYCAVFAAAAYFLVKHRRHERTGNAFVFKNARHVFSAAAVLAVTLIITSSVVPGFDAMTQIGVAAGTVARIVAVDAVLWLLTTFGFFCAFEFAGSKGEKNRKKRFALFAPIVMASAAVTFAVTFTQGFGAAYQVPVPDNIDNARISVEVGDMYFSAAYFDKEIYAPYFDEGIYGSEILDDQPDPSEITNLHRDIITGVRGDTGEVEISYALKSGVAVSRKYTVPEEYLKRAFELTGMPDIKPWELEGIGKSEYVKVETPYRGKPAMSAEIPSEEFLKAIKADCADLSYERAKIMNTHSADENCYFWVYYGSGEEKYSYGFSITVNSLFTRTIDLLEQYGIPREELFPWK
ncbi:MAG: hypothetical protein IK093_07460 [Ruminiclostridium sp.]|nr:hypothetical protein [Ruminiclostridium sp.]